MNDIDTMPTKCHDCPYWEICKEPYVCPNDGNRQEDLKDTLNHVDTGRNN